VWHYAEFGITGHTYSATASSRTEIQGDAELMRHFLLRSTPGHLYGKQSRREARRTGRVLSVLFASMRMEEHVCRTAMR